MEGSNLIYLDNAATTRVAPEVFEAMSPFLQEEYGNPSSVYALAGRSAAAMADARRTLADFIGAEPEQIIFTGGGSEADNLAIKGIMRKKDGGHMITSAIEHHAVLHTCKFLQDEGYDLTVVGVDENAMVDPDEVADAIREDTRLITIMHSNNEVGTLQPLAEIAQIAKERDIIVHTDAVQSLGKVPLDVDELGVDLMAFSAHKIHGPQGVGALLVRPGVRPRPLLCGGDQQEGLRPGTLDLAGIAGFGVAARILVKRRERDVPRMRSLTDGLIGALVERIEGARPLGDQSARAPGIAVIAVPGVRGEVLLHALEMRGVLASSSSACHSSRTEPPRSLRDAGLGPDEGAVRLSLTIDTSQGHLGGATDTLEGAAESVRHGRAVVQ